MKPARVRESDITAEALAIAGQTAIWINSEYEGETEAFTHLQTKCEDFVKLLRRFRKEQAF